MEPQCQDETSPPKTRIQAVINVINMITGGFVGVRSSNSMHKPNVHNLKSVNSVATKKKAVKSLTLITFTYEGFEG